MTADTHTPSPLSTEPMEPPPRDPVRRFTELAAARGLIRPGDKLDKNMVDFAHDVAELAACIGDAYGDDATGGNAGEHIRAELGADPSSDED